MKRKVKNTKQAIEKGHDGDGSFGKSEDAPLAPVQNKVEEQGKGGSYPRGKEGHWKRDRLCRSTDLGHVSHGKAAGKGGEAKERGGEFAFHVVHGTPVSLYLSLHGGDDLGIF